MKNIVHSLFRLWIRVTSWFFFEKIIVSGKENLPQNCPVIFACNHPNSFLDSIVMTTSAGRPLHYIARGDFFDSKIASFLLRYIQILPIFRKEEGKENLYKNGETFSYCVDVLKKNGAVVIFSEGLCENEYNLRPLRKGTARLAYEAWNNPKLGEILRVVPVAIQYSSWLNICPRVYVDFLQNIEKKSFADSDESGVFNKKFNEQLKEILLKKCIVVDKSCNAELQNKLIAFTLKNIPDGVYVAKEMQDKYLAPDNTSFKATYRAISEFITKENIRYYKESETGVINFIFSVLMYKPAYVLNAVPYYFSKYLVHKITKDTVFYDSLQYSLLMFIYPVYLLILFYFISSYMGSCVGISIILLALVGASIYENACRNIQCFLKKDKLKTLRQMLTNLFETNNG